MCLFEGEGDVRERVFLNEVEYASYFLEIEKIGVFLFEREKKKRKERTRGRRKITRRRYMR